MAIGENNLIIFFSSIVSGLSYSYFISSNLPTRTYKLISLIPIFYLFTTLPLLLSSPAATAIATFFFTWLANFKLVLFVFDRGPLYPQKSLTQFIILASLPAKIKSNSSNPNKKYSLSYICTESIAFPLLLSFVYKHKHYLNTHIILFIYCFLVFLYVDLLVFVSNALIRTVLVVELEQPSDKPYLATSLQDFWGKRWNLMVTNILSHTIYKPVKLMFSSKDWGLLPAILATFVVSGLMHELMFYYMTRVGPTWETTSFFVLHGVCVVVELVVKRALAGRLEVPVVVSRFLTMGFVLMTSFWLFFPPLIESGADAKVIEEIKLFVDYVKTMFRGGVFVHGGF